MIGSTISILLAITWGGLQFPWTSAHVLAPLVIGAIGILVFFVLEMFWLKGPTVSQDPDTISIETLMDVAGRFLDSSSPAGQRSVGKFRSMMVGNLRSLFLCHSYLGTFFHGIVSLAAVCAYYGVSIAAAYI